MARIAVYVPDDLRAEMDKVESLEPNWSAIAQEAFRVECQRLLNRKQGASKMQATIERLRAQKTRADDEAKVEGHASGRKWAMELADYPELERLSKWRTDAEKSWSEGYDPTSEAGLLWDVTCAIFGDDRPAEGDMLAFWQRATGYPEPSDKMVEAFVEGALEVFDEVEDKL